MRKRLPAIMAATLLAAVLVSGCQSKLTEDQRKLIESARQASIASCERSLGRPLEAGELDCIHVDFKNGQIVGSVAPPLSDKLARRQAELLRKAVK